MQHVTDRTRGHNLGGHATTVDILVGFIVPSSIVLVGCCNVVVFVLVSVCLSLCLHVCFSGSLLICRMIQNVNEYLGTLPDIVPC